MVIPARLALETPVRVLVTGASGYFGSQVVPALLEDPRVAEVVATDMVPTRFSHPRLSFVTRDLTGADPADLLAGIDAVVHLAFKVDRRPGEDVSGVNLDANQRFLRAAARGCDRLIVCSSIAAYGLRDEYVEKLTEDMPAAPGRGQYYCEHKIAAEQLLDALAPSARARIVRARPCSVSGPTVDPRRALQYQGKLQLMPRTPFPLRLQVFHEGDLGPAFRALLDAPEGTYNLAPDDALSLAEAARAIGQTPLLVPRWLYRAACDLTWRLGQNALDAAWASFQDYPTLVADNAKLRALGWAPRFSTLDALRATARAVRGLAPDAPLTPRPEAPAAATAAQASEALETR
jgi:nucleoside-diphosphate-sugar epimerase